MCKSDTTREEATENPHPGGTYGGTKGRCLMVFGEELLSKVFKLSLFVLLKQYVGLASVTGEIHSFVQKRKDYIPQIQRM